MNGNGNGTIDFHRLTAQIHGFSREREDHWDELIVKYLQSELVEPLAKAQIESAAKLAESLDKLSSAIDGFGKRLSLLDGLGNKGEGEWIRTVDAAKLLNLHPKTILKLAEEGKLNGRRLGQQWRFNRLSLIEMARERGVDNEGRD